MITSSTTDTGSAGLAKPYKLNALILKCAIVASLGALLFGFDTAVISGATKALREVFSLDETFLGFTVAIAIVGTTFGAMFASGPSDKYGARECLKVTGLLFFISSIGCGLAWDWYSFLAFRFVGGLAIGASSVLGPIYIAEVAPAQWRGRLVALFQFTIVLGILVAYVSNFCVGLFNLGAVEWRVKLAVGALPAILFFFMLCGGIPRSPRWLVKKREVDEARSVLTQIGEPDVEGELSAIIESIDAEHGHANEPLFSKKYRVPVFLAVAVAVFNQLSGINAMNYYAPDIFRMAGFSTASSDLQTIAMGTANLIFTILGMVLIDKLGRKILLLVGTTGTAICLGGVAAIFYTGAHKELLVWMLMGFIACFAFGSGAVIWVYISEVFPNRVRAKGQSLGSFTHWLICCLLIFSFPALAKLSGSAPFFFFAVMMVVQFFVVAAKFPETKGISLEDMQKKLGIK